MRQCKLASMGYKKQSLLYLKKLHLALLILCDTTSKQHHVRPPARKRKEKKLSPEIAPSPWAFFKYIYESDMYVTASVVTASRDPHHELWPQTSGQKAIDSGSTLRCSYLTFTGRPVLWGSSRPSPLTPLPRDHVVFPRTRCGILFAVSGFYFIIYLFFIGMDGT